MSFENFKQKPKPENKPEFMSSLMKEKIASIEETDQKHAQFMNSKTEEIISKKEKSKLLVSGVKNLSGALAIPTIAAGAGLGAYFTGETYALPQLAAICTFISLMGISPISSAFKEGADKLKQYFNID